MILPRLLVSACLCGHPCRYDATAHPQERFVTLEREGIVLAVCPEVLGGLPVPRPPCEIRQRRVVTDAGRDVTQAFTLGALKTLELARQYGIHTAVLKEGSPSCGSSRIYDGSFGGIRVPGRGMTAALLLANGFTVYSEENAPDALP